jgi:phosphoglycolate phosphatase
MSSLVLPDVKIDGVKMVVFDKDGTLIDVHYYWCSMIEIRADFFVESLKDEEIDFKTLHSDLMDSMGINLKTKKMKPEGPVGIKPRSFIIDVAFETISKYTNSYTKDKVVDVFLRVDKFSEAKLADIVKPLPGVHDLLQKLKEKDVLMTIATTDITSRALLAMKDLSLEDFFIDVVGADLVQNAKPHPDLVNFIINRHDVQLHETLVIGDSMADLNMAKNAKCRFLAVKTGLFTDEFIRSSKYVVENLRKVEVEL